MDYIKVLLILVFTAIPLIFILISLESGMFGNGLVKKIILGLKVVIGVLLASALIIVILIFVEKPKNEGFSYEKAGLTKEPVATPTCG